MQIEIIGEERLERLSSMLASMGGDPFSAVRWGVFRRALPEEPDARHVYLAEEIINLREEVKTARHWLDGNHHRSSYNAAALEAFLEGRNYEPPLYEYGSSMGNYRGDLVSKTHVLYLVRARPNYREELVPIARMVSEGVV
jgi:hypothetical protein